MRVVVADDALLTREGIVHLLREGGLDVVGEAGDADGLLREVRRTAPDVAIVDIKMPPTHTDEGLQAAQRIRDEHPDVGVLVLSQYLESSYAMRLLETHPAQVGYLLKERIFTASVLLDAVRRVHEGETVVDPTSRNPQFSAPFGLWEATSRRWTVNSISFRASTQRRRRRPELQCASRSSADNAQCALCRCHRETAGVRCPSDRYVRG
jgi:DNA-binding NarL/FixJ family response regulator